MSPLKLVLHNEKGISSLRCVVSTCKYMYLSSVQAQELGYSQQTHIPFCIIYTLMVICPAMHPQLRMVTLILSVLLYNLAHFRPRTHLYNVLLICHGKREHSTSYIILCVYTGCGTLTSPWWVGWN